MHLHCLNIFWTIRSINKEKLLSVPVVKTKNIKIIGADNCIYNYKLNIMENMFLVQFLKHT